MKSKQPLLPKHRRNLKAVGGQLRLARKRRKITTTMMAQRAGISRNTLSELEKGSDSVSLSTLYKVLVALGLTDDYLQIGKADELGRQLEDIRLGKKQLRGLKSGKEKN